MRMLHNYLHNHQRSTNTSFQSTPKYLLGMVGLAAIGLLVSTSTTTLAQQLEPASAPEKTPETKPAIPEPTISFGVFTEPIELTTLIDYVGSSLNISIVVKGTPTGEIVFNAPQRIAKSKLIDFLDAMLELYNFTIVFEQDSGFYIVEPIADLQYSFGTDRASTLIIPTPNIKPSLLINALTASLGTPTGKTAAIQAVDELGVLIVNAPPRDIRRVEAMVTELLRLDSVQQYIRFELDHLAAPIALDRVRSLIGGSSSRTNTISQPQNRNIQAAAGIPSTGSSLSNLADRLTVDPQGNALIFKGIEDEIARVRKVLAVIDVPNTLEPRNYFAGSSATQIANIAKRRGLGEVIEIEATTQQNQFSNFGGQAQQFGQSSSQTAQGGPVMLVNPEQGSIIYYGTDDQQAQLAALLEELKTEDDRVVIREYVLNHTDALTIADLLNGIITGEAQTGNSALLPGSTGRATNRAFNGAFIFGAEGEAGGDFDPNKITVIADEFSNQIIIKAPIKQQEDLKALIVRLDKQRSQVYIQAIIVSIADNEDFTLAFETQINAGQYSAGTSFGLSSSGTLFQDPKIVGTGLGGLTQAIIMSEYLPLIVNASQTDSNVRILSTPQLLVNDNVESTIVSVSEQPFDIVTPSNGDSVSSFGGFEEAGTTLTVTPSISEGGFIRLEYSIELSNFTAATGTGGSPPPRDRNTLTGSVTVPSDATIVLGGITVEDSRNTVIKVPLLGDIPILGELFKRTSKIKNKSKLYVFLTPRIMRDPNFNDLKLFTKGPQGEMEIDMDMPTLEPALIMSTDPKQTSALPAAPSNQTKSTFPQLEPAYIELTDAKDGE